MDLTNNWTKIKQKPTLKSFEMWKSTSRFESHVQQIL